MSAARTHYWTRYSATGDGDIQFQIIDPYDIYQDPRLDVDPTSPAQIRDVQSANELMDNGQEATANLNGAGMVGGFDGQMENVILSTRTIGGAYNDFLRTYQAFVTAPDNNEGVRFMNVEPQNFVGNFRWGEADAVETPKKKVRIPKIKKEAPDKDIAKAIAKHTKTKAQEVDKQTKYMEGSMKTEELIILVKERELRRMRNSIAFFNTQKARLTKSKRQIIAEFEQAIIAVKQLPQVEDVTIDSVGRIIVTTTPLNIMKDDWDKPRTAGKYQIRIDFVKNDIHPGVRVLNITQRHDNNYDSPTISNTHCCWGNIRKDIERDFFTQNIEELVVDMIEYITSNTEGNGYLAMDGQKGKGWEQWFSKLKKQPRNYSWEKYDREVGEAYSQEDNHTPPRLDGGGENREVEIGGAVPGGAVPGLPTRDYALEEMQLHRLREMENSMQNLRMDRDRLREELSQARPRPQTPTELEIWHGLRVLGINEQDVPLVFRQITATEGDIGMIDEMRIEAAQERLFRMTATSTHGHSIFVTYVPAGQLVGSILEVLMQGSRRIVTLRHDGQVFAQTSPRLGLASTDPSLNDHMSTFPAVERSVVPGYHTVTYGSTMGIGRDVAGFGNNNMVREVLDATGRMVEEAQNAIHVTDTPLLNRMLGLGAIADTAV